MYGLKIDKNDRLGILLEMKFEICPILRVFIVCSNRNYTSQQKENYKFCATMYMYIGYQCADGLLQLTIMHYIIHSIGRE